jgi:hypothetical protein
MTVATRRKEVVPSSKDGAQVKLRWLELDVQGGTTELVEGFKSLATALRESREVLPVTRSLAAPKATGPAPASSVIDPPPTEPANSSDDTELEATGDIAETTSGGARPKRTPPPALEVLSDIDLDTGKVMPLKEFVAQKRPAEDSDYERFATIAVWHKENHALDEVNASRIYTAYRFLGWVPPTDPAQVLRNLKANKKWFDKGDSRGGYKINMLGLKAVLEGFGE